MRGPRWRVVVGWSAALGLWSLGCSGLPTEPMARGRDLYVKCAGCHGDQGLGNEAVAAPAIAGLPKSYIFSQVKAFQDGIRGAHADDVEGLKMRPMSKALASDQDVEAVAVYVASMRIARDTTVTLKGDEVAGRLHFTTCRACHGADGSGNDALKAPPLRGLQDWYVASQLRKFKAGIRGTDPREAATGGVMRPMAAALPDEQAMKDVAAYIKTLAR